MRKFILILSALLLVAGLVFLLFEPVSVQVEKIKANNAADDFDRMIESIEKQSKSKKKASEQNSGDSEPEYSYSVSGPTQKQIKRLKRDSIAYNKSIVNNQFTVDTSDFTSAALKLGNYGITDNVYGYVSAPSIGMRLPVYLGASDSAMNYGAAHLMNTSLPVDMTDTNCAIAGHTGYFGRVFFDNIRYLGIGDTVSFRNYWQTVNYKVIKKKTVSPKDTRDYVIQPGRRMMVLITCVSNGKGGFDRCIVICEK